jgi:hypothetical protein
MFRYQRSATVKNAADLPAAIEFGGHVTSYINKQHALKLAFGVELFGAPSLHWYFDAESLDKSVQVNAALLQDRGYNELLSKAKALFIDGSVKDTIVTLVG